jgi:transcriptional regulator NrdR family protein
MKCPLCNAATRVLEVRARDDGSIRRTRECFNLHRYTTEEVLYMPKTGRVPMNGRAWRARALDLDARDAKITADMKAGLPTALVAETYGVSARTVKRVLGADVVRQRDIKSKRDRPGSGKG